MSISGISSNSLVSQSSQNWQTGAHKVRSEFQQLGQDLQTGNLSKAQSDFKALSQNLPASLQPNGSLSQACSTLRWRHHPHPYSEAGSQDSTSSTNSTLSQLFGSLGSALQAGNLSAAQTAYSTLQQDLQQLGLNAATTAQSSAGTVNIMG